MINSKKIVAIIPARGGSKSIPYKNIKDFLGKPLIAWAIEAAKSTREIDRVIVSTDNNKIAEVAKRYGAEVFMRPAHLAEDDSLPIDLIKDIIHRLNEEDEQYSYIVYLEPTSPLRSSNDIKQCLELLTSPGGYSSVATFSEAELNPHRAWKITDGSPMVYLDGANPWLPRQKLPEAYQINGAVYCFLTDSIRQESNSLLNGKVGAIIMPKIRSVDIDDKRDFIFAELLMKEGLEDE